MESLEQMEPDDLMNFLEDLEWVTAPLPIILLSLGCRRTNEALLKETQMFEKYLKRIDPKDLQKGNVIADCINC